MAAILLPVARIMLVGIAPTLVAYLMAQLVARGDERHGVLCVAICNLAGLAPFAAYLPGRLLHVNVLGCTLFAAVSGSSAATGTSACSLPAGRPRRGRR